jgi:hypothetical protein
MHWYVADVPDGEIVYSQCPFNKHVPTGVALERDGVRMQVSIFRNQGRDFIQVWLQVPEGKTVVLQNGTVTVRRDRSQLAHDSAFPNVSLVDNPIVNSYSRGPGVQEQRLAIGVPLVGERLTSGGYSWDKNFWLATYVDTASADDIWVTLPAFTINGAPANIAPLHFHRKLIIEVALINC